MSSSIGTRRLTFAAATMAIVAASCSTSSEPFGAESTDPPASDALDAGSESTTIPVEPPSDTAAPATDPVESNPPVTEASTDDQPEEQPDDGVTTAKGAGQACVASREGVSCLLDDGTWVTHDESTGLSNNFVVALDVCDTGEVLAGNSSALDLYDGARWLQLQEPFEFGGVDHIQCIDTNNIWVGGFDEVAHWDGTTWEQFPPETFGDGILEDLELAPDGQPWVGSTEGVFAYDGTTWTSYTEADTFQNHSVDDMSFAPNGRLEVSLLLSRATFENGKWTEVDYNGTSKAVAADDTSVLIGTFNKGVDLITGGTTATLDQSTGELPTDKVESMTVDAQGRVWVGTQFGLVVIHDGVVQATFQMDDSEIHDNLIRNVSVQGAGPSSFGIEASPATSKFSGVITDGSAPIAGAEVEICVLPLLDSFDGPTPCSDQPASFGATAGSDGSFAIDGVTRGRYVFVVNGGDGWIQATGQFGISSERVLIDSDLDIGDFAAVADEE